MKVFHKPVKSIDEREPKVENFAYYSNFSEREPLLPKPQFSDSDNMNDQDTSQTTSNNSFASDTGISERGENLQINLRNNLAEYVRDSYDDKLNNFEQWIKLTVRRLEMLHDLYNMQNLTNTHEENYSLIVESKIKNLEHLQKCLDRRNAAGKTFFLLLFNLERFLSSVPSSLLISNRKICFTLCDILESWLKNSCFLEKNFNKLKQFLKAYFRDGGLIRKPGPEIPSLDSIQESWKLSLFFTEKRQTLINEKKDYFKAFYFSVLIDRLETDLQEAAFPIESLNQQGQKNISKFHDFLNKYDIPFSGPFRRFDSNNPTLVYFISSLNPSDAIINNYAPLYGCYDFELKALKLGKSQAQEFWENLEFCPYWLSHYPPWFNLDLSTLREQIQNFP